MVRKTNKNKNSSVGENTNYEIEKIKLFSLPTS